MLWNIRVRCKYSNISVMNINYADYLNSVVVFVWCTFHTLYYGLLHLTTNHMFSLWKNMYCVSCLLLLRSVYWKAEYFIDLHFFPRVIRILSVDSSKQSTSLHLMFHSVHILIGLFVQNRACDQRALIKWLTPKLRR